MFGREKKLLTLCDFKQLIKLYLSGFKDNGPEKRSNSMKSLSDGQGQRMARLVQIDRKGRISHLLQPENREGGYLWMQRALKLMDGSRRRPRPLLHLTAETVKQRLWLAENWTMFPDLRNFLIGDFNGSVKKFRVNKHENVRRAALYSAAPLSLLVVIDFW